MSSKRRNIKKLIEVYRLMERYISENDGTPPALLDLVAMGASPSTSVVNYYKLEMQELRMIRFKPRLARSLRLLPLDQADARVVAELEEGGGLSNEKQE